MEVSKVYLFKNWMTYGVVACFMLLAIAFGALLVFASAHSVYFGAAEVSEVWLTCLSGMLIVVMLVKFGPQLSELNPWRNAAFFRLKRALKKAIEANAWNCVVENDHGRFILKLQPGFTRQFEVIQQLPGSNHDVHYTITDNRFNWRVSGNYIRLRHPELNDRGNARDLEAALTKRIQSDPAKFMHELATMLETPADTVLPLTQH